MTERIRTVYKCDYCGKTLLIKSAMGKHEKWCSKNPENARLCYECAFLHPILFEDSYDAWDGEHEIKRRGFRCEKYGMMVYPVSVERRGLNREYSTFDDQEPMRKECAGFSDIILAGGNYYPTWETLEKTGRME
jgi:hypothetical protein